MNNTSSVLSRFSTSEAVLNYFKKEIEEGHLIPGEKLPSERILQKQLHISRFSLREGLARLSALGIIKIIQGKGAFVSSEINSTSLENVLLPGLLKHDPRSYEDIFDVRLLIEERISVLASKRRSNEDLRILKQILEESEIAINDAIKFGEFDYLFHNHIAKAAGNPIYIKMLDVINKHLRSFLYDHARDKSSREKAHKSHWQIYECIKKKQTEEAGKVTKKHIKDCKKNYETLILKKGNKQS